VRASYERLAQNGGFVNNYYFVVLDSNVARENVYQDPPWLAQGCGTLRGSNLVRTIENGRTFERIKDPAPR
jgi:hypothetical protein